MTAPTEAEPRSVTAGRCHLDGHGVPTLAAGSLPELAYLQGWHVATERAWQIDCEHRRVTGTSAEVFGPAAVPNDVAARQMDLDGAARAAFAALEDPVDRAWFTRFADGVNAGLGPGARRAPEFAAYGAKPLPFDPHTPLALHLGYNLWLTNAPAALFRALLAERFPALATALVSPRPDADGSNAWAVRAGANGTPLLAADPHRLLELPGVYQQVRLVVEAERAEDRVDVVGLAFPGVPGVPHVGQSEHVAWVTTSAMVPSLDVLIEDAPDGPDVLKARTEQVHLRGGEAVDVRVARTAHGQLVDVPGAGPVSMRFPAWDRADTGLASARRMLTATTAAQVCTLLDGHVEPVNRVIVADARTVLTRHAGAVLKRGPHEAWGGRRATTTGAVPDASVREWVRWPAPVEVDDIAVAANEPHPHTADLTADACAPWRARRIREALSGLAPEARTVEAMASLQTDTRTPSAPRAWLAHAIADLVAGGSLTASAVPAWDGDASPGSAAAAWWLSVEHAVAAALIAHLPTESRTVLGGPWAPWGDAAAWVGAALAEHGPELLRAALDVVEPTAALVLSAVERVAAEPPRTWGEEHAVVPFLFTAEHPGGPEVPGVADALAVVRSTRVGGTADTVCAASHAPGLFLGAVRGPVARVVFDLGDRARSRWVVPFGVSGLGGAHVTDQLDAWAGGRLLPVPTGPVPEGAFPVVALPPGTLAGRVVAEADVGELGLTVTRIRPDQDAPLVHALVTEPRARFYGMRDHSVEQVQEVYDFLEFQPTHANYLVWHGQALVALVQLYDPRAEAVGGIYDVQDGDLGFHVITAPDGVPERARATAYRDIVDWIGGRPGTRRLVIEPDVQNTRAVRTARLLGFTLEREVDLPDKRAALCFRTVDRCGPAGRPRPDVP